MPDFPDKTARFNVSRMELAERRDGVIAYQWKVYEDNFHEGDHVPVAPSSLMRELDYTWRVVRQLLQQKRMTR